MDGVVGAQPVGVREIGCGSHEALVDLDEIELREQTVELGHQPARGLSASSSGRCGPPDRVPPAGFDPRQAHGHDADVHGPSSPAWVGAGFGDQEWISAEVSK